MVSNICYFHSYLWKWSNLTIIFQMGWNRHQVVIQMLRRQDFHGDDYELVGPGSLRVNLQGDVPWNCSNVWEIGWFWRKKTWCVRGYDWCLWRNGWFWILRNMINLWIVDIPSCVFDMIFRHRHFCDSRCDLWVLYSNDLRITTKKHVETQARDLRSKSG